MQGDKTKKHRVKAKKHRFNKEFNARRYSPHRGGNQEKLSQNVVARQQATNPVSTQQLLVKCTQS